MRRPVGTPNAAGSARKNRQPASRASGSLFRAADADPAASSGRRMCRILGPSLPILPIPPPSRAMSKPSGQPSSGCQSLS